jgi:hypothetical protein
MSRVQGALALVDCGSQWTCEGPLRDGRVRELDGMRMLLMYTLCMNERIAR